MSLGIGNRIDVAGGQGASGCENGAGNQVGRRWKMEGKSSGKDN